MADLGPQTHCHRCGTPYVEAVAGQEWPRRCPACCNLQFFNPKPIGVLLQPVSDGERIGILTPIRGGNPMRGHPALTGGFHEAWDSSSEHAGCREYGEEIRLPAPDEDDVELLVSRSTGHSFPNGARTSYSR